MSKPSYLMLLTSLSGFSAVLLGAIGAHALKAPLLAQGTLESWQTAAHYQLAHTLGALGVLVWAALQSGRQTGLHRVAGCWLVGCLLFSGSIYILALGGPRALGPITPLGGLAFLAGWALLARESLRRLPAST